jgi:hypothetical protein
MHNPQNQSPYRSARKAFIAACQAAGSDSIARVHPWALAPDGKPLFIDSVALGPRNAGKALLVVTGRDGRGGALGSLVLQNLLQEGMASSDGARLVLVHALNPFGFAWNRQQNEDGVSLEEPEARHSWSFEMLGAILSEDVRSSRLRVLDVGAGRKDETRDASQSMLAQVVKDQKPGLDFQVARLTVRPEDGGLVGGRAVARALASL